MYLIVKQMRFHKKQIFIFYDFFTYCLELCGIIIDRIKMY